MKKFFWIAAIPFCCLVLFGCSPQIEKTVNKEKVNIEQRLEQDLITVAPSDGKVLFESSGMLGRYDEKNQWQKKFVLGLGEQISGAQDHHSSLTLMLKEITPTNCTLSYVSEFNHTSFGKNLITRDEGEIEISFKK